MHIRPSNFNLAALRGCNTSSFFCFFCFFCFLCLFFPYLFFAIILIFSPCSSIFTTSTTGEKPL
ncbi:hypothetical protein DAA48_21515 [Aeromonas veronii]|uniref:Uncharacterized protein n=1 Tax=Aeromonas veronii TaxID=654 RepID=A0A2T4MWQ4_AERVE|nr:hypothetical protein DAA48_21515 [Aeromonas veronii]